MDFSRNDCSICIVFPVIHQGISDEKFAGHFVLLLSSCKIKIQQNEKGP
jgi:hypothetical protein